MALRTTEFYDNRYRGGYMDEWPADKKKRVRGVVKGLNLPGRGAALDYGCGNGEFTGVLKEALPGWEAEVLAALLVPEALPVLVSPAVQSRPVAPAHPEVLAALLVPGVLVVRGYLAGLSDPAALAIREVLEVPLVREVLGPALVTTPTYPCCTSGE